MTDANAAKTPWTEPKLELLDVDLTSVASGNNYFADAANNQQLARKS